MEMTDSKIHSTACIDEGAIVGAYTKIWHFSHVLSGASIGEHCVLGQNVTVGNNVHIGNHVKIQNNVSVYEGVRLDDYVFCGPSMVFTNIKNPRCEYPQAESQYYIPTHVKRGASIGANATIICGITIGRYACIGAGAVVTKDVPDYAIIVGNPGTPIGWMSRGGEVLAFDADNHAYCQKSNTHYYLANNRVKERE